MKLRYILAILLIAAIMVACEKSSNTPLPDNPQLEEPKEDDNKEDENKGDEENKEDENKGDDNSQDNSWIDNPTPMPEATYALDSRIAVTSLVTYADGMRNDYMTLYDETTGYAVYMDIYTDQSNTTLPTGRYLLSNETVNTVYYQWSYFTPYTNSDLYRFAEGWAEVIADAEHSSGYPYHKIRAYFLMESGESVSIDWEGTITFKN